MTLRESIGYILFFIVLLFFVLANQVTSKLDWLAFGTDYQKVQAQIIEAFKLQNDRLSKIEKEISDIKKKD